MAFNLGRTTVKKSAGRNTAAGDLKKQASSENIISNPEGNLTSVVSKAKIKLDYS